MPRPPTRIASRDKSVVFALLSLLLVSSVMYFCPQRVPVDPAWSQGGNAAAASVFFQRDAWQEAVLTRENVLQQHANWAVTYTTNPTLIVKQIASLDHWRVVVVTDAVCSGDWLVRNVTCLSLEKSRTMGFSSLKYLAGQSSLKNIGYLYAISHGARVVYDVDAHLQLLQEHIPMLCGMNSSEPELVPQANSQPCAGTYTLVDNKAPLFNPYPVFGQPYVCARGVTCTSLGPLDSGGSGDIADVCFKRSSARPLIQQSLINGFTDVDEKYHGSQPLNVTFERSAFSVVLPHGTAAPLNSFSTLFLKDALWALLLPISAPSGLQDIWRGLWAQRLLWDIGGHVALLPPTATRARVHPPDGASSSSCPTTKTSDSQLLLQELLTAQPSASTLQGRMLELTQVLVRAGFLQARDVQLMKAWIADLEAAGYQFPALHSPTAVSLDHPVLAASSKVTAGSSAPQAGVDTALMNDGPLDHTFVFPSRWCTRVDTDLVINMNRIGLDMMKLQIRLLHAVYRPWFRRVYITGSLSNQWTTPGPRMQALMDQGYYINCGNYSLNSLDVGAHPLACAAEGIALAQQAVWLPGSSVPTFNVMYTNDDVAFSPCLMARMNRSSFWYNHPLHTNTTIVISKQSGPWWDSNIVGRGTLKQALTMALQSASGLMAARMWRLKPGEAFPWIAGSHGQADLFYVPAKFQQSFLALARHFQAYHVFNEHAVPNIIGLLREQPDDIDLFTILRPDYQPRDCLLQEITKLLPLGRAVDAATAQRCMGGGDWITDGSGGLFAIHPIKLSGQLVRSHWLQWWLSQDCVPLSTKATGSIGSQV